MNSPLTALLNSVRIQSEGNISGLSSIRHLDESQRDLMTNDIPEEVLYHIFGWLSISDLARSSCVCTCWRDVATSRIKRIDLCERFPKLEIIDEESWKSKVPNLSALEISADDLPPLNKSTVVPILEEMYAHLPQDSRLTLLTVCKGVTLNKLNGIIGQSFPSLTFMAETAPVDRALQNEIGNVAVGKSYRVLITNDTYEATMFSNVEEKRTYINQIGCEIPGLIATVALSTLTAHSNHGMTNRDRILTSSDPKNGEKSELFILSHIRNSDSFMIQKAEVVKSNFLSKILRLDEVGDGCGAMKQV